MGDLTKNLSRHEFACKCGCGFDTVDFDLPPLIQGAVDYFQEIHPECDIRVTINSGCRCEKHNEAEGGSDGSYHLKAKAADIVIYDQRFGKNIFSDLVADYFELKYPNSKGIGRYIGRTHIDSRATKGRWDMR